MAWKRPKKGYPDEVADEEIGIEKRQREGEAEDHHEDVDHPALGVLRADLDDLLGVADGRGGGVEAHVTFDVDHRAVGAGDDGLHRGAGEPIDDRAAHEQAQ